MTETASGPAEILVDSPAAAGSMAPRLSGDGDRVWLSWLEPVSAQGSATPGQHTFRPWQLQVAALDSNNTWTTPTTIARSAQFFVNWADFPDVSIREDGHMLSHWLERAGAGYAYDVVLTRSTDDGQTWTRLGKAHDDFTQTEHGFVSYVPTPDGWWTFWLDGRAMAGGDSHGHGDGHGHGAGTMSIRGAYVSAGITQRAILDDRVCECCNTDAALTNRGPVVVYRDRADDETRDISIVRHTDEGWSDPASIHNDGWVIAGCPVNGPAIDADGETVVVTWFTSPNSESKVLAAFSFDAGATFQAPIVIDDGTDGSLPLGRVNVLLTRDGQGALVGWVDTDEDAHVAGHYDVGGAAFRIVHIDGDGTMGRPTTVAPMDTSRASGFPQMARRGERLIVAWTESTRPSRVRVAHMPIAAFE